MKQKVTIIIEGAAKSGKSTIAAAIEGALVAQGIETTTEHLQGVSEMRHRLALLAPLVEVEVIERARSHDEAKGELGIA